MRDVATFIALNRFGLGGRPGDARHVAPDPRGWLEQQLGREVRPEPVAALAPLSEIIAEGARREREMASTAGTDTNGALRFGPAVYRREVLARTRAQIVTDQPFRERLVAFWSNHFTVSVRAAGVLPMVGAFEREAIRPHVTGRFVDLLTAVVRHPAMLQYLNNTGSIGPRSPYGRRRRRGLNENLARELLELHTLGVDGGYGQDDVIALAKILTGWSLTFPKSAEPGRFRFRPGFHEPGPKVLLGRRYAENGVGEGEAALRMLAAHPATATFVATKLARHFVADAPEADVIARLAGVFTATDGDLAAVSHALIHDAAAWRDPLAKLKTPNEFVVAAFRATGAPAEDARLLGALRLLGQMPFSAPSPAGWPDTEAEWIGPEAVLRRIEWASAAGQRLRHRTDARSLYESTVAAVAPAGTAAVLAGAPSVGSAVGLILASPAFQRR